jgi:hypothetical protein
MNHATRIEALPRLPVDATAQERQAAFWRMSRAERLATYRRGELTFGECLRWGARRPDEPPHLGGEFEYIAALTPEWAEAET